MDRKTFVAATLAGIGIALGGVVFLFLDRREAGIALTAAGVLAAAVGLFFLARQALAGPRTGLRMGARAVARLGLLLAVEIVLSRFLSISAWNLKIGLSFIPVVLAAVLYGPLPAAILGGLGDFLGAILFPIGPYFPGFTLTAFLTGMIFGLFLYRRRTLPRILASVGIIQFVLGLLINSWWISLLYGSPYGPLLAARAVQAVALTVIQILVIWAITRSEKLIRILKG